MKRVTFSFQVFSGIVLLGICFVLGQLTHNGLFLNGAWILYGVAFLIHPVWPESWAYADPVKMRRGARIGGCLCILVGLLTRFGV